MTWVPHEIHPETPAEGRPATELFDQFDIDNMTEVLRRRGEPYGIEFKGISLLSNSRLALEAAEFARDHGAYDEVHHALFKAYFTDGRNIGDREVLLDVLGGFGLDLEELVAALDEGRYTDRVKQGSAQAKQAGVTAIPSFVVDGIPTITGAIDESLFRKNLEQAARKV